MQINEYSKFHTDYLFEQQAQAQKSMRPAPLLVVLLLITRSLLCDAEPGYRLWLRYDLISNKALLQSYRQQAKSIFFDRQSPTLLAAKSELISGLSGLLGVSLPESQQPVNGSIVCGTFDSPLLQMLGVNHTAINDEGFVIRSITYKKQKLIVIGAPKDIGVLYGVFHFLRLVQTHQSIQALQIEESPKTKVRILNHWDNLDGSIERGYAGFSLWNWHKLPTVVDQRYIDYARANASIGINGSVLTNVNANALILTPAYLEKVAALADNTLTHQASGRCGGKPKTKRT